MFAADDEDGDFLSPTGGAKLASLFGLDQAASQGNESFQYTAPKQPRKTSNPGPPGQKPSPPPGAPAVLQATATHAFKYLNGQYAKQGKLGAAVLGNHTTKEYKLLLYASQQKQVTAAKIHVGFVFTVQPSNYCTFYDDQRQNWSLMFETEKAATDFCKEVCLAKVNSAPSLDVVVGQDLCLGEGQGVENGDSLEVAYTGWLLQNHTIGQMFDSNLNKDKLLRLKLGAGKVIKGWEEGMLGMRKSGRRLMVIPSSLGYGSQGVANRIPADSTLIFEAELRRVKLARDSAGSRDSAAPSPAPSPAPSVENLGPDPPPTGPGRPGEPPLRSKSNSLSEQLTNPDATKAKLISRMAKMGQPMLPFLTGAMASQPDSSDSEMEDPSVSRAKERLSTPSPVQISTAPHASAQALSHPHAPQPSALVPVAMTTAAPQAVMPGSAHAFQPYAYAQTSMAPSQLQPMGQMYPAQTVPFMGTGDVTSFLMTEARQHNTEIRLAVGKVADKVDQLASKMDSIQKHGEHPLPNMSMETSMIMHNIQRIIQENECLKTEVFEKSSRVEEQNKKIGELINQNQRYMEQSNLLMEQRNDSLKSSSEQNQARVLQAEQDKHALPQDLSAGQVHLTEELATSTARVAQLQLEATSHQQRASELQSKLAAALVDGEGHCVRISSLESQLEELKEAAERAQAQYRTEKQKRREMELKMNNVDEEVQDLKTDKESLERTLSDRKRKWQAERQRCDEELEELRRSSQQEMDSLRAQLRKARTSTDQAASEQLNQLQAELEEEWRGKSERALASAREQQARDVAELTEQRDALDLRLAQLQDKFTAMKQVRASGEQNSLQQQGQSEELQALRLKYAALEERSAAGRRNAEEREAELERRLAEQGQADTAGEVKRVMNGVFHSLRGEFDLNDSYTGSSVLGVIVNTIKNVTLQLLNSTERPSSHPNEAEEQGEQEGEKEGEEVGDEDVRRDDKERPPPVVNGKKEPEAEEKEEEQRSEPEAAQRSEPEAGQRSEPEAGQRSEPEAGQRSEPEAGQRSEPEAGQRSEPEAGQRSKPEAAQRSKAPEERGEASGLQNAVRQEAAPHAQEPIAAEPQTRSQSEPRVEKAQVPEIQPEPEEKPPAPSSKPQTEDTTQCPESAGRKSPENRPSEGEHPARTEGEHSARTEGDETSQEPKTPSVSIEDPLGDPLATPILKGPPTQPPPPPNPQLDSPDKVTSLTEGVGEENGEEPFFPSTAPTKPPPPPTEDEEEDELSLKGRPPPAPLFGDEEDEEDDLDWLG